MGSIRQDSNIVISPALADSPQSVWRPTADIQGLLQPNRIFDGMVDAKVSKYILAYGLHRAVFMPDLFDDNDFLLAMARIFPVVYVYIFSVESSLNGLHI